MVISKNYKNIKEETKNKNNHLRIMMDFLRTKKNPNILELGVERGASTTAFNLISEEINGMVYSIDIEDCKDVVISPNWNFLQSNDLDYEFILKKFPVLEIEGIDLIYIDSYHENHHVLKLLNIWFKYLKKNGAIFVDDIDSYPFKKKKDIWNSIIYDLTDETIKKFYYSNEEKIFYTKYFGENGLAKLEKLSGFLDKQNKYKSTWNYNPLIKLIYPYLRFLKKILKKIKLFK